MDRVMEGRQTGQLCLEARRDRAVQAAVGPVKVWVLCAPRRGEQGMRGNLIAQRHSCWQGCDGQADGTKETTQ